MARLRARRHAPDLVLEATIRNCVEAGNDTLRLWNAGPEGAASLARRFHGRRIAHLMSISFGISFDEVANPIGDPGAASLQVVLRACPLLTSLELRNNAIGDAGARALSTALEECPGLQLLDLEGNRIGSDGARALIRAGHNSEVLRLRGITVPHDSLGHWLATKSDELEIHAFGDRDVKWLAERFAAAHTRPHCVISVKLVGTPDRHLTSSGIQLLAASLSFCSSLRSLHLVAHRLTLCKDLLALVGVCQQLPTLHTLGLRHNGLAAIDVCSAATALGQLVCNCPSLRTLDLQNNELSSDFAACLLSVFLEEPPALDMLLGVELASAAASLEALEQRYLLSEGTLVGRLNVSILGQLRALPATAEVGATRAEQATKIEAVAEDVRSTEPGLDESAM